MLQYAMQYTWRRPFSQEVFSELARWLWKTVNVQQTQAPLWIRSTRLEESIINVFAYMQNDPTLSTRKNFQRPTSSKTIFHEILQQLSTRE